MAGKFSAPVGNNPRICYSCGNSYPESVRFCPKDSTDLEYLPPSIENLAQDFRRPWKKWVALSIISAFVFFLVMNVGIEKLLSTQASDSNSASGELTVRTTPAGAAVFLDGSQVGMSPVRLSLPTGAHEVRAVFPGYSDGTAHIEILPSATQRLVWDLSPLPGRKVRNRNLYLAWLPVTGTAAAKGSAEDLM